MLLFPMHTHRITSVHKVILLQWHRKHYTADSPPIQACYLLLRSVYSLAVIFATAWFYQHRHISIHIYIYTRTFGRASRGLDSFYDLSPDTHCSGSCLIANKHSLELEPGFRDQYAVLHEKPCRWVANLRKCIPEGHLSNNMLLLDSYADNRKS